MPASRYSDFIVSMCLSLYFVIASLSSSFAQDDIQHKTHDNIPAKVAILPFTWAEEANESVKEKHPDALDLARQTFSSAFSLTGYDEIPIETVDQLISQSDIENQNFSTLLENGIDGIIQAEVHHIAIGKGGIISRSNAEIDFTMINLNNDQVIWSIKEEVSRMGGLLMNSGQLTRAFGSLTVTEDQSNVEITNVLLDLYTKVLESIPPAEITLTSPTIASTRFVAIEETSAEQPAGIQIWLEGTAGCSAYFDSPPDYKYIPFIEYIPGNYFTFFATDTIPTTLTIHIENGLGIQSAQEVTPTLQEELPESESMINPEVLP